MAKSNGSAKRNKKIVFSDNNRVKLVRGGREYFDLLLQLIHSAKEFIHLQTYIFSHDETGSLVADALKKAAERNVAVYLLVDGYASQALSKSFIADLKSAGVNFRFFEPLFRSRNFYFGRRMHHKVFVADARHSLVGGINIADRYNDFEGHPAWLDFALYCEGELVKDICVLCWKTWYSFPVKMGITPCEQNPTNFEFANEEKSMAGMRRNDWVRRKNEISSAYIDMIRNSRSHIRIVCSYFLPGIIIRRLLRRAAQRGVRITVITAGPSDIMLAKHAERWLYDWLLRNNIDIYEYQPTILHAKMAVCDERRITVGSYNINNISAYASVELNLDVINEKLAKEIEYMLDKTIEEHCVKITPQEHTRKKNLFTQFIRWSSYQIIRIVFYSLTFYYKQRR
jgi:cardiolipin synthase